MIGFVVRSAFWLSLVLIAIPFGGTTEDGRTIGPFEALSAARVAVADMVGICERQPGVCVTGKAAINTIGVRARDASRFAYQVLDGHFGEHDETVTGTVRPQAPVAPAEAQAEPVEG